MSAQKRSNTVASLQTPIYLPQFFQQAHASQVKNLDV